MVVSVRVGFANTLNGIRAAREEPNLAVGIGQRRLTTLRCSNERACVAAVIRNSEL
jgi:hypothetical protein